MLQMFQLDITQCFHLTIIGSYMTSVYMEGLAWMVISPKNWEFLPFSKYTLWIIQPCLKS